MAILGTLLKKGIKLRENLEQEYSSPAELQKQELKHLLITASQTEFGKYYGFQNILNHFRQRIRVFIRHFVLRSLFTTTTRFTRIGGSSH